MFITYNLLVFFVCLISFHVRAVQIRLTNNNRDNLRATENQESGTYSYNYGISNEATGDNKSKWEKRENNVVRGAYSIVEPDGTTRLVEYTADANGFHPVIKKLDALNPSRSAPSTYNVPNSNVYSPSDLTYRTQGTLGSNSNYERNLYQNNLYRAPASFGDYNNEHYSRVRFASGHDNTYRQHSNPNLPVASFLPPLRQDRQPVPLLHSAYHGYDNLYH
ncbi:hypothetical protein Trydic_g1729 [Trypoxylus dichotomus]